MGWLKGMWAGLTPIIDTVPQMVRVGVLFPNTITIQNTAKQPEKSRTTI